MLCLMAFCTSQPWDQTEKKTYYFHCNAENKLKHDLKPRKDFIDTAFRKKKI